MEKQKEGAAVLESPAILKGLSLAKGNTLKISLVVPNDPGVAEFLSRQFDERIDITVKELPKASGADDKQKGLFELPEGAEED